MDQEGSPSLRGPAGKQPDVVPGRSRSGGEVDSGEPARAHRAAGRAAWGAGVARERRELVLHWEQVSRFIFPLLVRLDWVAERSLEALLLAAATPPGEEKQGQLQVDDDLSESSVPT